jgi:hypothetical protein
MVLACVGFLNVARRFNRTRQTGVLQCGVFSKAAPERLLARPGSKTSMQEAGLQSEELINPRANPPRSRNGP